MKITIQTNDGTFSFEGTPDENILYSGLRQGVSLPHDCATGTCGTCRARLISGNATLRWEEAPGLKFCKREKGDILMCQAVAAEDCELRVPARLAAGAIEFPVPGYRSGVIGNIRPLTHDVVAFDLALDRPMSFHAGQFVALDVPGLVGRRAYSMTNHASEAASLSFVIKRKPEGGFSDWLFEQDVGNAELGLFGPLGGATFHPEEGKNLICIGGGSGIAGMLSIISRARREAYFAARKGHVFFGVRTLADGFCLDEFESAAAESGGNLEVTLALSDEAPGAAVHPDFPSIRLAHGFVHEVAAASMAGRYDNHVGYVAGPTPMVDAARRVLRAEGRLAMDDIRYDKFT